jgi:hypothetical protein
VSVVHRRITPRALVELATPSSLTPVTIDDAQRVTLSQRFMAVRSPQICRLDAWLVEQAGEAREGAFTWSPHNARRVLAASARRHLVGGDASSIVEAVRHEMDELLARAARGYARPGSLAHWLARHDLAVHGVVMSEAISALTDLVETFAPLDDLQWCASDAYYDVASARTTLRGRRDATTTSDQGRVLYRVRTGAPGSTAGAGLRVDALVDGLVEPTGQLATRVVGLWPEAGVMLSIDVTMADARAAARDLVRTAMVVQHRSLARVA